MVEETPIDKFEFFLQKHYCWGMFDYKNEPFLFIFNSKCSHILKIGYKENISG